MINIKSISTFIYSRTFMETTKDDILFENHAIQPYGGVEVMLHTFLTSAPDYVNGHVQAPAYVPP
jgi:hypothetical protein